MKAPTLSQSVARWTSFLSIREQISEGMVPCRSLYPTSRATIFKMAKESTGKFRVVDESELMGMKCADTIIFTNYLTEFSELRYGGRQTPREVVHI